MKELLNYQNATHLLRCRHAIGQMGQMGRTYFMRCHILKEMPDGRLKLQVYGDRYWSDRRDVVKVRYVDADRVLKKAVAHPEEQQNQAVVFIDTSDNSNECPDSINGLCTCGGELSEEYGFCAYGYGAFERCNDCSEVYNFCEAVD